MLGIHGVGRDRADYYLSDLARELPLSGPGRWVGTARGGHRGWREWSSPRPSGDCSRAGIPGPRWSSGPAGPRWRPST